MARQYRWVLAALLLVVTPLLSEAGARQTDAPPPPQQQNSQRGENRHERRLWWKDARDMAEIGLTPEQSSAIDGIFQTEIEKMKPMRESINQDERALNDTIRENTLDVALFTKRVQRIEKKRAELNIMRTVMLYRMRRVLNADQNAKFQTLLERREAERRRQDNDRRR